MKTQVTNTESYNTMNTWWHQISPNTTITDGTVQRLPYPLKLQITEGDFDTDTINIPNNSGIYIPDLTGVWAIEERAGRYMYWQLNRFIKSGGNQQASYHESDSHSGSAIDKYVTWYEGNTAVVEVSGTLMRETPPRISGGGKSCISYRQLTGILTELSSTEAAKQVVLKISSFGGNSMGAFPCADSIYELNKMKPITAYIDDNCCSAAYLLASQCKEIIASEASVTGSIGVVSVLIDDSKKSEMEGIKRVVVASSKRKGLGLDGKVTVDLEKEVQDHVNETHEFFRDRVMRGRKMTEEEIDAVSNAKIFYPKEAQEVKLIDRIANFHDLFDISTESDKPTINRHSTKIKEGSDEMDNKEMEALQTEKNAAEARVKELETQLTEKSAEAENYSKALEAVVAAEKPQQANTDIEADDVTETVTESDDRTAKLEQQLEAERKARQNVEAQVKEMQEQKAQEDATFRTKLVSNWVENKVANHSLLPKDAMAIKTLINSLVGNQENVVLEYTSNDGTTQKIEGQHYEVAIRVLDSALSSRMNFSEMGQVKQGFSAEQKADIESDWFSKQMEADGYEMDHKQSIGAESQATALSVITDEGGTDDMGISTPIHADTNDSVFT